MPCSCSSAWPLHGLIAATEPQIWPPGSTRSAGRHKKVGSPSDHSQLISMKAAQVSFGVEWAMAKPVAWPEPAGSSGCCRFSNLCSASRWFHSAMAGNKLCWRHAWLKIRHASGTCFKYGPLHIAVAAKFKLGFLVWPHRVSSNSRKSLGPVRLVLTAKFCSC